MPFQCAGSKAPGKPGRRFSAPQQPPGRPDDVLEAVGEPEIAERIRPLGLAWWGEARIDTLLKYSERSWRLMRDAGLRMVFMGAESGSLETLQRMDKGGSMSPPKTLEIAARMKAYGIVPEFSFVLGSPPDPAADIQHTLEFIRRVKRINPASEIVLYHYTPVPLAGDLYGAAQAQASHPEMTGLLDGQPGRCDLGR